LPPAAAAAVRIEVLGPQRDVVIAPPGHALSGSRRGIALAQLAQHPLLLLDRSTATRAYLDAGFAARGLAPRVAMEMSSVEVLKRLVELGFGVGVVPQLAAVREVAESTLVARPLAHAPGAAPRQIGLVTPTSGPLSRAARAFVDVARGSSWPAG
jgi:DNA-binding transcriptional LysR family regulator